MVVFVMSADFVAWAACRAGMFVGRRGITGQRSGGAASKCSAIPPGTRAPGTER